MMDTGVAKGKRSSSIADEEVEKYTTKRRTLQADQVEAQSVDDKFADIESNLFHQIVIQSEAIPTEKRTP